MILRWPEKSAPAFGLERANPRWPSHRSHAHRPRRANHHRAHGGWRAGDCDVPFRPAQGRVVPEMSLRPLLRPWPTPLAVKRSPSPRIASGRRRRRWSTVWPTAGSRCWRTCAFTPVRRAMTQVSAMLWRPWAISTSAGAFSAAHRAHASTDGLARRLPAAAGRLMQAELEALERALGARPVR